MQKQIGAKCFRCFFSVLCLSFVFVLFFAINVAGAAEFKLAIDSTEIFVGDELRVDFVLNAEGQVINALDGSVSFTADRLFLKELRDAKSVVNFWIEKPALKNNKIVFSGIVPGGYSSPEGNIFSAIFVAKKSGIAGVVMQSAQALLNDGVATPAKVSLGSVYLNIGERSARDSSQKIKQEAISDDIDKPEKFLPEISRTPELFGGKWFIVFSAQDKGIGMDHYEVLEIPKFGDIFKESSGMTWVLAESPYVLMDQSAQSDIYVKAVDKAGNVRIVFVPAPRGLPVYESYVFWCTILVLIIFGALVARRRGKVRR